jgi:16S rRNA (guanine(966)-N(2))-methyltransferase RsmD
VRVIAGELGGQSLVAPRGWKVRPTSDRVREAIFSALGERVAGATVLDLYCGTGALAIEALSRGAERAAPAPAPLRRRGRVHLRGGR